MQWTKRFQFSASDGHFDFRDEQVQLDGGFLTVVFRAFQSRAFRFPKHFDMSAGDGNDDWMYTEHGSVGDGAESNVEKASQALRMAAATDAMCTVRGVQTRR